MVSLVDYLNSQKIDSSYSNRAKLALKYGIQNYSGTAQLNLQLLKLLQGSPTQKSTSPAVVATPILRSNYVRTLTTVTPQLAQKPAAQPESPNFMAKAASFVKNLIGVNSSFGGGQTAGGGAGGRFGKAEDSFTEDYDENTQIVMTFNLAYKQAKQAGLSEFTFNGKRYKVEDAAPGDTSWKGKGNLEAVLPLTRHVTNNNGNITYGAWKVGYELRGGTINYAKLF